VDFMESLDRLFLKSFVRGFSKISREGFFLLTFLRELSKIPREGFFAVFCVFLGFFRVFVGAL
jgi:hypothetical protein